MNEMISYMSVDMERMLEYFHSVLLWAEGKSHRIPASRKPKREEIVRFKYIRFVNFSSTLLFFIIHLVLVLENRWISFLHE